MSKVGHPLTENFDFRVHLLTFGAENKTKSWPFKTENNAQTLPKQLENNFVKVHKTIFFEPKIAKNEPSNRSLRISIFEVYYRPLEPKRNT